MREVNLRLPPHSRITPTPAPMRMTTRNPNVATLSMTTSLPLKQMYPFTATVIGDDVELRCRVEH